MFAPGEYYIGDLCYVLPEEIWLEICQRYNEEEFTFLKNGRKVALFQTAYGDGEYYDQNGNCYAVDSGTIGIVAVKDVDQNKLQNARHLSLIQSFDKEFEVYQEGSVLNFGGITIDTDPEFDDCEEGDDEEGEISF